MARSSRLSVAAALAAAALAAPAWFGTVDWTPDSLFYQARVLEFRGATASEALARTFEGAPGADERATDLRRPPALRTVTNALWVAYSRSFYARRLTVPAMAVAVYPVFGSRSLKAVSLLGYVLVAPFLFLLLHRRFANGSAFFATVLAMSLSPVLHWSARPLTDSWGLLLLVVALLAGIVALERGRIWILVWAAAVLALSFTRDSTLVALGGVTAALVVYRSRRAGLIVGAGIAAALPAPLLYGAHLKAQLAYVEARFLIPGRLDWGSVIEGYPRIVLSLIKGDLLEALHHPISWALFFGGLLIFVSIRESDLFMIVLRGGLVGGCALLLLSPNYTGLRLEFVFVPMAAAGLAWTIERGAPFVQRPTVSQLGRLRSPRPVANEQTE